MENEHMAKKYTHKVGRYVHMAKKLKGMAKDQ